MDSQQLRSAAHQLSDYTVRCTFIDYLDNIRNR